MDKQVKISLSSHQILIALAAKKDRSLKDFLEQCIQYFKVTELDPKEIDTEGIRSEIKKLDRRIVSFFKVQEKEKIEPMLDELSIIAKTITESLSIAPTRKDFAGLADAVTTHINKLITHQNGLSRSIGEIRTNDLKEIKQKARIIFSEYIQEVDAKGPLASRKSIDDKFKKLFETL